MEVLTIIMHQSADNQGVTLRFPIFQCTVCLNSSVTIRTFFYLTKSGRLTLGLRTLVFLLFVERFVC